MEELVELVNNEIITSSRKVAEVFGKEHYHVLRDIDTLIDSIKDEKTIDTSKIGCIKKMFFVSEYRDKTNRTQKEYLMNRDGFSLLVMGFTGEKALGWKIKYINAFNEMEAVLKQAQPANAPALNMPLNDAIADLAEAAKSIEALFAVKHCMALAATLEAAEKAHGLDLSAFRSLLPPADNPGFLNPTTIGEQLGGLKPATVNKMLCGLGLQYKTEKGWRLTDAGRQYGEEKPYTRNGHSGYQIVWSEKVMGVLK